MRVRWMSAPGECLGRFRETGSDYDDFPDHIVAALKAEGRVADVPPDPVPVRPPFLEESD